MGIGLEWENESTTGLGLGFCIDLWIFQFVPHKSGWEMEGSPGLALEAWGREGAEGWSSGWGALVESPVQIQ